ncbi:MAG: hypothetical protein WCP32_16000 [Bacteroidota bacterium]
MITNNEEFTISIEIFNGNESDHTTVIKQLQQIKNEFGAHNVVFVGDRGMRMRYNLEQMKAEESLGIKYITALSIEEIRCMIKEDIL